MEIVINIPDRIHYAIELGITVNGSDASQMLIDAVKNGTPLPKWHGDLVDKNTLEGHYVCSINLDEACVLKCECKDCSSRVYQLYDDIDNIPVVVKADKESEE